MLPLVAITVALAAAPPALPAADLPIEARPLVPVAKPAPERPDDGLLGKGVFVVKHELPPAAASLLQHLDDDRGSIAVYVEWGLWLATVAVGFAVLATLKYLLTGWRRAPETRPPWR